MTGPLRRLQSAGVGARTALTQNLGGRPGGLVPFVSVVGSCLGRNFISLLWKRPKWTPDICQDFRDTAPHVWPAGGTISTPGRRIPSSGRQRGIS